MKKNIPTKKAKEGHLRVGTSDHGRCNEVVVNLLEGEEKR